MRTMKAAVFIEPGRIVLQEKPIPSVGFGEALIRVTTTTICGTDVHILKGEYPVAAGRIVGHEPVGVIEALGPGVTGYKVGQRVIVGAITPCGQCDACLDGHQAQCGGKPIGGWRFGNTIDGCQAEFVLVPHAMANLAPVPDGLSDEQVLMCPDIMSTGFGGAESGGIKIGDTVAVFAQGPIGLCATAGAKLMGATRIIAVDRIAGTPRDGEAARRRRHHRFQEDRSRRRDHAAHRRPRRRRRDRGARHAADLRELPARRCKPGGVLSSLGVYSGKLSLPLDAIAAGLGDHTIVTTLCPGGKERMRRLMNVLAAARLDLKPLVTHRFPLDQIEKAYDLFANQRDGVLKVAITA